MGAAHVSAVYAQWSHLPDRPFRALVYMALIAKDATPEPAFWAGRDGLCIALGLPFNENSYRIGRRAVAELIEAGAVERVYVGHNGKRSEYRVNVTPRKADPDVPLRNDTQGGLGGHHRPPKGGHLSPERRTPESGKADTTVPPRSTKSMKSEKEEETSPLTGPSPSAREGDKNDQVSPLDAKRIVREFIDQGGVLNDLLDDAPEGMTRTERTIYAATKIREAS